MCASVLIAVMLLDLENPMNERIKRKILRDHSNPLATPDAAFIEYYRLNKDAFRMILEEIRPFVQQSSIPLILQLSAALRFLAEGGYQKTVGKDADIALARSTVSKVLTKIIRVLEVKLCSKWIKLNKSDDERQQSKRYFYNKYGLPGVIGCIDGSHVRILKPHLDESLYLNRKGHYSINAMTICDYNMNVITVDACRPGSSHDSLIWNLSSARHFFLSQYNKGERGSWLLGDSGYDIEPFLLTPFKSPDSGSSQHKFNRMHASAHDIVKRTFGVIKSRFRCLQTSLPYKPEKVVKIINVCCALHNICRHYNIPYDEVIDDESDDNESDDDDENLMNDNSTLRREGQRIRDEIASRI